MTFAERRPRNRGPSGGRGVPDVRLGEEEFRRIARAVREYAGITLLDSKMALVQARLSKRLRALAMTDFRDYCRLIEGHGEPALIERQELITAITTNVTRFFREPHHFDVLRTRVLPPLIARARRGGRVRLWSAGCSTGEEPYTIALTLLECFPEAGRYDVRILATDLDRAVLATASRGIYPARAVEIGARPAAPDPFRARLRGGGRPGGRRQAFRRRSRAPVADFLPPAQSHAAPADEGLFRRDLLPQRGDLFRRGDRIRGLEGVLRTDAAGKLAFLRPFRAR